MKLKGIFGVVLALACVACGSSSKPEDSLLPSDGSVAAGGGSCANAPDPHVASTRDRYSLANGCFVLKSVASKGYAVKEGNGSYAATADTRTAG